MPGIDYSEDSNLEAQRADEVNQEALDKAPKGYRLLIESARENKLIDNMDDVRLSTMFYVREGDSYEGLLFKSTETHFPFIFYHLCGASVLCYHTNEHGQVPTGPHSFAGFVTFGPYFNMP